MNGFVRLIKPPGMTSHDVVAWSRRILGTRAVGHTGTLDPAASGLLILTVGKATRLGEYLLDGDKAYRAEIALGVRTDSADADGEVVARASAAAVNAAQVSAVLTELTGELTMRPPAHSAVRIDGKKSYHLARAGRAVEAPARQVQVRTFRLEEFIPGEVALARVTVECSKGTYIRSLAEMLGERLGCGGMLAVLIRTRLGPHDLAEAVTLEELAADPAAAVLPPADGLPHLPRVTLGLDQRVAFCHGNPVPWPADQPLADPVLVMAETGELLGLGEPAGPSLLRPRKVFAEP